MWAKWTMDQTLQGTKPSGYLMQGGVGSCKVQLTFGNPQGTTLGIPVVQHWRFQFEPKNYIQFTRKETQEETKLIPPGLHATGSSKFL